MAKRKTVKPRQGTPASAPKNPKDSFKLPPVQDMADSSASRDVPREECDALANLGAELMRRSVESEPALEAAWNDLMANWGVRGEPVGVHRLRAMMQEESGTSTKDNAFSRELIALRADRGA